MTRPAVCCWCRSHLELERAPAESINPDWWAHPRDHVAYPCRSATDCDPLAYTINDVYLAEIVLLYALCANRGALFDLASEDVFECALDGRAYTELTRRINGGTF